MTDKTRREIVSKPDRFIFGQNDTGRAASKWAIAADICVYTNGNLTVETIKP